MSSHAAAAEFVVTDTIDAPLNTPSSTSCVSTDGGACTLRAAIQAADNSGGASTITLAPGTYRLTIPSAAGDDPSSGDLDIDGDATTITLAGAGAASTVIDTNGIDRAFAVQSGESLALSGVSVTNGSQPSSGSSANSTDPGQGGEIYNDGSLTISDSALSANTAGEGGGAVYSDADATATTITGSTITGSASSFGSGGAIFVAAGAVSLSDDTITAGIAGFGGGGALAVIESSSPGAVAISASNISDDSADFNGGGAIYVDGATSLSVTTSTLSDDHAGDGAGGAIYADDSGPVSVTNSTLSGDDGSDGGGAIYEQGGTLSLANSVLDGDSSSRSAGGALYISGGSLSLSASTLDGDSAGYGTEGGAVYLDGSDLTLTGSTLDGDEAYDGGAVYIDGTADSAAQQISASTFADDAAEAYGGAIDDAEGSLAVLASTLSANIASSDGGALYYGSYDGLSLTNDTFDSNEADESGGAIYLADSASTGTVTLLNDTIAHNSSEYGGGIAQPGNANSIKYTIVADNAGGASSGGAGDCYGNSASDNAGSADTGGNLDDDGSCFSGEVSGNHVGVDLRLGPLASNGGPTQTDALLPGSPAIGAAVSSPGFCPARDERGVPRPQAGDSGAFQTAAAAVGVTIAAPASAAVGSPLTYTLTVTSSGSGPATGVIVTDALSPGMTLSSVSTSQGSCTGTTTIVCSLGTLDSTSTGTLTTATVALVAIPSSSGTLTNLASVRSDQTSASSAAASTIVSAPGTSAATGAHLGESPLVLSESASKRTDHSARIAALIATAGEATTYTFDVRIYTAHAKASTAFARTIAGGTLPGAEGRVAVSASVGALRPRTTYEYRVVASNATGVTYGQDMRFTTRSAPVHASRAHRRRRRG
jgi:uncharacterized repeat protein (TIGR01451 family)